MNLQQLRIFHETAHRNFSLTEVAHCLHMSQSGVSRQIRDLEKELGVTLLVRKGKRVLGLTQPGRALVSVASRILLDVQAIERISAQFCDSASGILTIATTHTQARYVLPEIIPQFRAQYPRVHLILHEGTPEECLQLTASGVADIAIASEAIPGANGLVSFEFYRWHHVVVVPRGHPLDDGRPLSISDLTDYPILTYHEGFTGRRCLDEAFARAGLQPKVVMSALDADVIKTYVQVGLGVGIVASMAHDPVRDENLRFLPAGEIFGVSLAWLALRRGVFLPGYAFRFLALCRPDLSEEYIRSALTAEAEIH